MNTISTYHFDLFYMCRKLAELGIYPVSPVKAITAAGIFVAYLRINLVEDRASLPLRHFLIKASIIRE
jgi:hypothetical protein